MADRDAKPRVFIGSSTKGLDIARHAQAELDYDADAEIWNQAIFKSTNVPIENLLRLVQEYDFALFILHPEDLATVRNEEEVTVRDNVIFELGLFLGKLGRSRVFFIAPQQPDRNHRNRLYLPTDLSGITPPEYNPGARNVRASVATSLDEFRRALTEYTRNKPRREEFEFSLPTPVPLRKTALEYGLTPLGKGSRYIIFDPLIKITDAMTEISSLNLSTSSEGLESTRIEFCLRQISGDWVRSLKPRGGPGSWTWKIERSAEPYTLGLAIVTDDPYRSFKVSATGAFGHSANLDIGPGL